MRGGKPTWKTHGRLMHTTQTAWQRPRDNIRKPGVRDPEPSLAALDATGVQGCYRFTGWLNVHGRLIGI